MTDPIDLDPDRFTVHHFEGRGFRQAYVRVDGHRYNDRRARRLQLDRFDASNTDTTQLHSVARQE